MCDSQGAIALAKNPTHHSRTKHIDVQHHFIREQVEVEVIELKYVPTQAMVADVLTKALGRTPLFAFLIYSLVNISPQSLALTLATQLA